MNKKEKALALRNQGMNCSQTVFCTYAEDFGIDMETAWRLSQGLGGGFGGRKGLCGAISAMGMVIGLKTGGSMAQGAAGKKAMYARVNAITERFIQKNGSDLCAELKAANGKGRTCTDLILDCIDLIETWESEENENEQS